MPESMKYQILYLLNRRRFNSKCEYQWSNAYTFCSGVLEQKPGKMECPECDTKFEYDDRMECVFVDTSDLRLPINGAVCTQCGVVQGEDVQGCFYCGKDLNSTIQ